MSDEIVIEVTTSFEIAKRELIESIMFFFEERDPVTYYILAFASHEIIRNVANSRGLKSIFLDDFIDMVNKEAFENILDEKFEDNNQYQRIKNKGIEKKTNFFFKHEYYSTKHGGSNTEEQVTMHWSVAQVIMLDSIEMLRGLGEKLHPEHIVFFMWINENNPDIFIATNTSKALQIFESTFGKVKNKNDCLKILFNLKNSDFDKIIESL